MKFVGNSNHYEKICGVDFYLLDHRFWSAKYDYTSVGETRRSGLLVVRRGAVHSSPNLTDLLRSVERSRIIF